MLIRHPLDPSDAAVVASIREHAGPVKGQMLDAGSRAAFDAMMTSMTPLAANVTVEPGEVAGVPGVWCRPANVASKQLLLHLHGGGLVVGSAHGIAQWVSHLTARLGLATFLPDYRLAPEHAFPAAIDDAQRVFDAMPDALVSGDSAGGGLALGIRGARAVAVQSPRSDYSATHEGDADLYLTEDELQRCATAYLAGHDPSDPRVSPIFGTLAPHVRVDVGTLEILLDDSVRLADRAEVHVWDGLPHVFPGNVGSIKAAALALDGITEFLRAHIR